MIYDVDSTWRDDAANVHIKIKYQLKELIQSIFIDAQGRPAMRIERYTRANDTMPWIGPRIWYANRTATTAEKVEENVRYVKLVFPVKETATWNGNLYNTKGAKQYEIISAHKPETINSHYFDSVTYVQQYINTNVILYQIEEEKFAAGVGLVYKRMDSLYFGYINHDTVGYTFTQKFVSYGK